MTKPISSKEDPADNGKEANAKPAAISKAVVAPSPASAAANKPAASTTRPRPAKPEPSSYLDGDGRPLYMIENIKGASGSNQWMWENAMLVMPSEHETKSGACLGAWCFHCLEVLKKTSQECLLNYHPTRNFKAISRHFKRHHPDLQHAPKSNSSGNNASNSGTDLNNKNATAAVARAKAAVRRRASNSSSTTRAKKRPKRSLDTTITRNTESTESSIDVIPRSHISLHQSVSEASEASGQQHRIVSPPTFHACGEGHQVMVTEHMLPVPLYRSSSNSLGTTSSRESPSSSSSMDIYFTIVEKIDRSSSNKTFFSELANLAPEQRADEYVEDANLQNADDMMIFLQGGPGFGAPVPLAGIGFGKNDSWAGSALAQYSRIIWMDQRGTGRSSPITKQSLERLFPDLFEFDTSFDTSSKSLDELTVSHPEDAKKVQDSVAAVCDFLAQFRADSIVEDAEAIKDALLRKGGTGPRPWGCALGQSFGGFCLMTYLCKVSNPPSICLFTGGIAPMMNPVSDVYTSLWGQVKERNLRYYDMYPGDIPIVKLIVKTLKIEPVPLPSGGLLTPARFLQAGIALGGGPSAFAKFHSMLASAFLDISEDDDLEFKRSFLKDMDSYKGYDESPFFYWLHEAIYADGPDKSPTNWAAHRTYEGLKKTNKEFDYDHTSSLNDSSQPTLFFGEMVFPWMKEDYQELTGVGLNALAEALAAKKDWGELYDGNCMRKVLSDGSCTAAAAVYHDDMYVDFHSCMKVTARGGPLEKCKVWVTNEYQHSGLRDDGSTIFSKLYNMATGGVRVPS